MTNPTRLYRGDLPPRPWDVERMRRALQKGFVAKSTLLKNLGMTQNQALCALDFLVVRGEVTFDAKAKVFSLVTTFRED